MPAGMPQYISPNRRPQALRGAFASTSLNLGRSLTGAASFSPSFKSAILAGTAGAHTFMGHSMVDPIRMRDYQRKPKPPAAATNPDYPLAQIMALYVKDEDKPEPQPPCDCGCSER